MNNFICKSDDCRCLSEIHGYCMECWHKIGKNELCDAFLKVKKTINYKSKFSIIKEKIFSLLILFI